MGRPAPPAALAAFAALVALAVAFACRTERSGARAEPAPVAQAAAPAEPAREPQPSPPAEPAPVQQPVPVAPVAAPAEPRETPPARQPERRRPEGEREGRGGREGEEPREEPREEKPRKGLPISDALVLKYCSTCHQDQGGGLLGRLSFMRKTPEGWELSLKRMIRLQHLAMPPEDARAIVRTLADEHGLARAEAERAMYETERRIHWSEEEADKELRGSCGECHTLGRVLSERRDDKEWKLLKATHLAFFPLARWQAFRGEGDGMGGGFGGGGGGGPDFESMTEAEIDEFRERRNRGPQTDQADKVLDKLAKDLPLFTPEWERWQVDHRRIPLSGTWDLAGHEPSRGDLRGSVTIRAAADGGPDAYDARWEIAYGDAAPVVREGKGLMYSGHSWRGRSQSKATGEPPELREVLLLSEDWNALAGRIFTGEYNEIGADVTLRRRRGSTSIHSIEDPAVMIPSKGREIDLLGEGFPEDLAAADFHLGEGVAVAAARRISGDRVRLTIDVARSARRGARAASFRAVKGAAGIVLYDTVDYVKVSPEQGLARVGGKMRPPQVERFEALAMNRGPDDELYTADDFTVKVAPARWSLEEFPVRENDDDAKFVGRLDPATGVFTPALDGPNPERRWKANNIGEVFAVATCRMTVQDVPPPKKPEPARKPGPAEGQAGEGEATKPPAPPAPPPAPTPAAAEEDKPVVMIEKEFRARGHLLVMVPIYVQWDRYVWDQR